MKVKFPKEIRVGKKTYKVTRRYTRSSHLGHIKYGADEIMVATQDRFGSRLSKEEQLNTFWHELTHGILHDMRHPMRNNEKFVNAFASRLTKAVLSAKF